MEPHIPIGSAVGPYVIEGLIGRGGMSIVYLARDTRLDRRVALKIMSEDLAGNETLRRRFIRESRVAASLEHPNIVAVYEADEANGILYIAMQYVSGGDLREVLLGGPLTSERAIAILEQVASALDAAHAAGLVHRDVKPGNVLLAGDATGTEHAYLTDFGLTRTQAASTALTRSGEFMGTIDYVSPEQIHGSDVDASTDVYSLGCVLFECLTGAAPFSRADDMSALYAHLVESPPKISSFVDGVPAAIDLVVARGVAKSPQDRYASCGELLRDARAALDPRSAPPVVPPIAADRARTSPPAVVVPLANRSKRRLAAAIVAAAVVGLLAFALSSRKDESPVRRLPTGTPLVRDAFTHDSGVWSPAAVIEGGALVFTVAHSDENLVSLASVEPHFGDVTIAVNAVVRKNVPGSGFGMVCRAADSGTFYELIVSTGGSFAIDKAQSGNFMRLASGNSAFLRRDRSVWRLRADCLRDATSASLTLFVDGRQVGAARDMSSPFTSGLVGLTALTGQAGGFEATFDDVRVWAR